MVTLTGKLGEKFAEEMLGIAKDHISIVDISSVFVAEINGSHAQHKRSFSPAKGCKVDEHPEIGKSYPALMLHTGDQTRVLLNATITHTFHDDGFENAEVVYASSSMVEMTAGRRAAKKIPGLTFPDLDVAN